MFSYKRYEIRGIFFHLSRLALQTRLSPSKAAQLLGIPTPGAGAVEALGLPQMHPALDGAPQWLGVGNTQDLTLGYLPLGQEHNVHVVIEAVPHIGHAVVRDHSRFWK